MMRTKFLLSAAILGAMAFSQANACAISAWGTVQGVVAADAGEPTTSTGTFKRYSARCGLMVTGAAAAKFVQDNSPVNATSYRARFYLFSGNVDTGAGGYVYLARNGSDADLIRIALTGGNLQTTVTGGTVPNIPVTANRWYSVEIEWAQGAAAPFLIRVKGNGAAAAAAVTHSVTTNNAAGVLKDVRLGLSAAATGTAFFDEYDSRRTTSPGRLCRGDANNSSAAAGSAQNLTGGDAQAIFNEIGGGGLASGQPDYNESGGVTGSDAQGIFFAVANGTQGCAVN